MGNDLLANATIQQLNLAYDGEQDRLLMKIGLSDESEASIWLTRRTVKTLCGLLQQCGVPTIAMTEAFAELDAKKLSHRVNYAEAYQTRPIARMAEPMLAYDCQLVLPTVSADAEPDLVTTGEFSLVGRKSLELTAKSGAMMRLALSTELAQALVHMLQLATKEAAWNIGFTSSRIVIKETSARPVLH